MKGAIAAAGDVAGRVIPGMRSPNSPPADSAIWPRGERRRTRSLIASTKALRSVGNEVMIGAFSVSARRLSPGAT